MKKMIIIAAVAATGLFSCAKEESPVEYGFEASFTVNAPQTKTSIDGLHVLWTDGDAISLYDGKQYTTSVTSPSASAVFTGSGAEQAGGYYYAVYPYSAVSGWTSSTVAVTLPSIQTAVNGGFSEGSNLMYAKSTSTELSFHHAAGYIRIDFNASTDGIKYVSVINNDSDNLAGKANLNCADGSLSVTEGSTSVILQNGDGSAFTTGTYYIAVYPGTYSSGLKFRFQTDTQVADVNLAGPISIAAGQIQSTGTVRGLSLAGNSLSVSFSLPDDTFTCTEDTYFKIAASVASGSEPVSHAWTIDGANVCSTATLKYAFSNPGTYTINYCATDASGATFVKSWTATAGTLVAGTLFESSEDGSVGHFRGGYNTVVENPVSGSVVNTTLKVVRVGSYKNAYSKFNFDTTNRKTTFPNTTRILRMMMYTPSTNKNKYYPMLDLTAGNKYVYPNKINGIPFDATVSGAQARWDALAFEDEWNVLEYPATGCSTSKMQIAPYVLTVTNPASSATGATSSGSVSDYIYLDEAYIITKADLGL